MRLYQRKLSTVNAAPVSTLLWLAKTDWTKLPEWFRNGYEVGMLLMSNGAIFSTSKCATQFEAKLHDYLVFENGHFTSMVASDFNEAFEFAKNAVDSPVAVADDLRESKGGGWKG